MDPFVTLLVLAGVLGLFYVGYQVAAPRSVVHRLAELRLVPTARLAPGTVVRIAGRVRRGDEVLTAPLSGRACLAFELLIGQGGGDAWLTTGELRAVRPFWLDDESGGAYVDPGELSECALMQEGWPPEISFGALSREAQQRVAALFRTQIDEILGQLKMPGRGQLMRELLLLEGAVVAVGGFVSNEPHPLGHSPPGRGTPLQATLRGRRKVPLLISDDPAVVGGDSS